MLYGTPLSRCCEEPRRRNAELELGGPRVGTLFLETLGNAELQFGIQASSEVAKKKLISIAAFSGESEPWMELRSMDSP